MIAQEEDTQIVSVFTINGSVNVANEPINEPKSINGQNERWHWKFAP